MQAINLAAGALNADSQWDEIHIFTSSRHRLRLAKVGARSTCLSSQSGFDRLASSFTPVDLTVIEPADFGGMVLHFGAVQGALVEQLQGLLIPSTHFSASSGSDLNRETEAHHHHDNDDKGGAPAFPTDREVYERPPPPPPVPHKHGIQINASVIESDKLV
ncbi:hypothetical protein BGW80DRAFT_1454024 [Lactifluus volemus]|nr:hypothetical protein BGW80DRAFT_1454024 [Lactifluus volemus]